MSNAPIVAVDPGYVKCGIAVLAPSGQVLHRDVLLTEMVGEAVDVLMRRHGAQDIVVGDGTAAKIVIQRLYDFRPSSQIMVIAETNTTLLARKRYWQEHSPGCLMLLLPVGMRMPPRPVDDYAAIIIGERFIDNQKRHQ
jgi:RNase H-fold protein (predicted Holliday junction resolvase)